jgi:hypothetical protein
MENEPSFKEQLTAAAMAPRARIEVAETGEGRMLAMMRKKAVEAPSGCLEWRGAVNNLGYGMVSFQRAPGPENRTSTTAHRKYWELTKGPIPDGQQVNHRCDNRRCINPDHMFLGDQVANIRDMMAKQRDNFRGKGPYLKRKLSAE